MLKNKYYRNHIFFVYMRITKKLIIFLLIFLLVLTSSFNDSFAYYCTVFKGEQKDVNCDYCSVGYFEGVPFARVWSKTGYADFLWIVCEKIVGFDPYNPVRCTLGFDDCGFDFPGAVYIGKNCYGRSSSEVVRTDSNDPYVPFYDDNHARCQVSSFGSQSDCYNLFAPESDKHNWDDYWGYWDSDEKACVKCDGMHREYWRAFSAFDYGDVSPTCEEACGAYWICDEHEPGYLTGYCDLVGVRERRDMCGEDCQLTDGICDQVCGADSRCHGKLPGDPCGPIDGFKAVCTDHCQCMKIKDECTSDDDCRTDLGYKCCYDPNTGKGSRKCVHEDEFCGFPGNLGECYFGKSYFLDKCDENCQYADSNICYDGGVDGCTAPSECHGKVIGETWVEDGALYMCNSTCHKVQVECTSDANCTPDKKCCLKTGLCVNVKEFCGQAGTVNKTNPWKCCLENCKSFDDDVWGCECKLTGTCDEGYCEYGNTCVYNVKCTKDGWIGDVDSNKPDCSSSTWECVGGADPDYCAQFSGDVVEDGNINVNDLLSCNSHAGCLPVAFKLGPVSEGAFMICSSCPYFKNQLECEILGSFKDGEIMRNGGKRLGCRWQPGDICYYNGNAKCTAEGGWICEYASSDETVGSCNCSETHTCKQGYCQSGNTCYYNLDCSDIGWIGSSESLDNKCENNIRHFDGVCTSSGVDFNKESCSFSRIFPAFHGYEVWNYTCTPEKCERDSRLYASDLKTFVNGVEAVYTLYVGEGCPVLKAWNGEEFKEIEKLNIHSKEGIDTVYSTQIKMEPYEEGIYKIILQEKWYALWEGSHIDSIKLTDSKGRECKLTEAIHSKRGDVLDELIKSDDLRVETKPGESIELTFTNCEGNEFNLEIEGFNPWRFPVKMALSYTNIMIIGITVSLLVVIILMFKRFMVRK